MTSRLVNFMFEFSAIDRRRTSVAGIVGLVCSAWISACSSNEATPRSKDAQMEPGGTVIIATASDADRLFPPLILSTQGKQVADLIYDVLADAPANLGTIGDRGFVPRLAERWTWASDSLSIAFHLSPRARWHDGQRVLASDVRFTFDLVRTPDLASPLAPTLANIDSVSVKDSLTAVVWYRRRTPEQFFETVYGVAILPEHVLRGIPPRELAVSEAIRKPVGSGRFRFDSWVHNQKIELVADTANWRGRPSLDRVLWVVAPDPTTVTRMLEAGEADFTEIVRGEALERVRKSGTLQVVPYPSLEYGYFGFNQRDPKDLARPHALFADRDVRRALSMAIDRASIVRNVVDSLGYPGLGPLTRAQATADTTLPAIKYDPSAASRVLDSLGWRDTDGDGIRSRDGRTLEFQMLVPTSSAIRMRMAVLLQEQLRRVGARVSLETVSASAFYERATGRRFDAILNAWHTGPSPTSVRYMWGSAAAAAGSNFVSYRSATFDALVDSASAEFDPIRSRALFRRAYEVILEDAPAVWLYELRLTGAAHRRLRITGVRADAWWAGIPDWSVPEDQRIARDLIGLRTASK
jgi:peptide/nickel transport system substrate-binding protein